MKFNLNKYFVNFSMIENCSRPTGGFDLSSLKNLIVHIYTKLHSKSFSYLLKICVCNRMAPRVIKD